MFTSTANLPERIGDPNHNCLASPPDQILTFCNSPDCLKPLCLECLAYHCMVHFQKGNQPILLEFKRLKENCTERLNKVGDYLGDLLTAIKKDQDSIPGNWGYHDIEAEKIRRSKEYLINHIEKYYKDLLEHYYLTSKPLETKLGRLYEEIKDLKVKLEENTSSSSSEVIKKVFDRNFEHEIAEIRKNFPGKNVIINDKSSWVCRNNIKVEVDYSKLYTSMKDELQKYTSIVYQPAGQETKASVFKKFTNTPASVFEDFRSAPLDSSAFLPRALSISKNSIYKGLAQDKPMFTRALEIKQLMESFKNGLVDIPKQMTRVLEMNNLVGNIGIGNNNQHQAFQEKPHEDTFGMKEISSEDSIIPNRASITISSISHKKPKTPEVYCIADDSSSCSFEVQELENIPLKQEAFKLEATHAAMLIEKSLEMSLRGSDFKKAAMNKAAGKKSSRGVKQEEKENIPRLCSLEMMPGAIKKRILEGSKENIMPGLRVLDVEIKKDGMEELSNVSSKKVKSSKKRIALRQIQNRSAAAMNMEEEEDDRLSLACAVNKGGANNEKSPFRIEDITPIKPIMNTDMKENMFITPNDPLLRMMQGEKTNEQSKKKLNVVPEENNIPAERMHLRISFNEEPKQEEVVKKRIEIILEDEDDDVVEEIPNEIMYKKMLPKQEAGLDEKNLIKFKSIAKSRDESNLLEQGRLEQLLENDFGDDPIEEEAGEITCSEGTDKKRVKREEKAVKKEPQPLRRSQRKKRLDQTSLTMEDEDCFKEVLNLMNASSKTKREEETTTMKSSKRQHPKVKKEEKEENQSVILRTPEKKSTRRKKKDTSTKTKQEEYESATTISTNLASSENLTKKGSLVVANHNSMHSHSEEINKTPMEMEEEEKAPEGEPENVYTPSCLSPISRFDASMTPRYYMMEGLEDNGTRSAMKKVDRSFDLITQDFSVNVPDYFQSDCKNKLLHFFQWRSKNLHIISINSLDIIQRGAPFQTIALDINFEIPDYHNSLITPTGDIYLTGGQDAKNAGQKYNNTYVVCFEKNTLVPKSNMLYRRDSHALCYYNGCLYALGGITVDSHGKKNVTNKCEKYVIAEDRWEEIAELNLPVCNHSASVFQDKYIFCFGGRLQPNKLSNNIFRYNLEKNTWLRLELKPTLQTQARLSLTSQAACFQINDKQIFVFGGYQANRNISSQSFLFEYCAATNDYSELKPATPLSKMDQSTSNIGGGNNNEKRGSGKRAPRKKEAMNIKRRKDICIIKGLSKKDLPFPAPFWDKQVIADDGKIYCLQNVTMSNNPKLSYSTTRRLLVFNGNEWTSLN